VISASIRIASFKYFTQDFQLTTPYNKALIHLEHIQSIYPDKVILGKNCGGVWRLMEQCISGENKIF